MGLCETVQMKKGEATMRVNATDVAKYRAQGWETTGSVRGPAGPAGKSPASPSIPADVETPEVSEEATESPALVTMEKDGATVDVAPVDVAVREEAGWVVATTEGQDTPSE